MKLNTMEYLRSYLIRNLIDGNMMGNEAVVQQWIACFVNDFDGENWFCAVVKIPYEEVRDFCEDAILEALAQCENIICKEGWKGYAVIDGQMNIVLVLPNYEEFSDDVFLKLANLLSRGIHSNLRIGIGYPYESLERIHNSKEEAYQALDWHERDVTVANICDFSPKRNTVSETIKRIRQQLMDQFRQGILENMGRSLSDLAEEIRYSTVIHTDAPYPSSIRRTMIELLVEMLHIASDEGVDVDSVIGYVDPYRKIFELQGTPAIIQWVTEIAGVLSEAMQLRKKRVEQTRMAQVKSYIQEHLADMELSLTTVSQSVGMSPSYFSAFFIREAGIGFKEYVTSERITLAQKMLKETKDSINTISEKCGFLSPSYFISVFKSHTGMTPGTYRKLKN